MNAVDFFATEYSLMPSASQNATEATFQNFFEEILRTRSLIAVIEASRDIFQRPPSAENTRYLPAELRTLDDQLRKRLFKAARSGFRVFAIGDEAELTALLSQNGYIASDLNADQSRQVADPLLRSLPFEIPISASTLLIGHDFDPIFKLQNRDSP